MSIKYWSIILFLLISGTAHAHDESSAHETSVPLQFNTGNPNPYGLATTHITIQGKSFPLIVDTGAAETEIALSPYALHHLKVQFTGKQVCFMALDGQHCQKEFMIPRLQIGSFNIANVHGTLMTKLWGGTEKGFKTTEASRNGVIGLKFLAKFNVLLNYPHANMILVLPNHKLSEYNVNDWLAIPFQEKLRTQLKIDDQIATLYWDTGSVPSIIKRQFANSLNLTRCPSRTSYGDPHCLRAQTSSLETLNGLKLANTWFMVTDIPSSAPFDALIGSNFFHDNLVYFDFHQQILYVQPATGS